MKNNIIILLTLFILSGCEILENKPDCSAISCDYIAHSIRVKYVDNTTGKALFSPGSAYTLADLKVTSAVNSNYSSEVRFDPNDPTVVIITPIFDGIVMSLGNLTSDKITMKTKVRNSNECCPAIDVLSLKINDETICAPCNSLYGTIAVIKK